MDIKTRPNATNYFRLRHLRLRSTGKTRCPVRLHARGCARANAQLRLFGQTDQRRLYRVGDADENDEPVAETRLVVPAHADAAQYDKNRETYSKAHGGG